MRIDTTIGALDDAAARVRALEGLGFDGAWAGEMNGDPFLSLAVAAQCSDRIGLGTSVAVALARSPMTVAYAADDLQRFSGGRLRLGLGSQVRAHIERRFAMPADRPAARMREYVLALRAIWAHWHEGAPLAFEGEFTRHTLMPRDFVPPAHDFGAPPILLAGVGPAMTRVAAEVADGFICHGFTTARWIRERTLPALGAAAMRDDFELVATPFVVTGTGEQIDRGVATLRRRLAFYASTPAYRPLFDLHGWGGVNAELTALSKAGRWDRMAESITDDMVEAFAVVAAVQDLPERLAARFGGLLTRLSFAPPRDMPADEVADLVRRIRQACDT
ncbi:TIGR03617 family F420-dependent LLM class oxidoreductase [Nocardia nova]|uniref:TIGR03617 family F420-dependent LLM class oxidoreductase n=1 Tax=Nocardia nova TaxID=37330 RepID=UPI0007A52CE7|nr:TIGR03617 family F420-dependent LLM class oxidoreductase [Nocardia nova]PPJ00481.1 TIGR03617 family F420-dependent LLM class oxidoreductase [Nocardia nova]